VAALEEFKNIASLVSSIIDFLDKVFGRAFLIKELEKLKWKPKSKLEEYKYLKEVSIHRAAKWYKLLRSFKDRGYKFDLRFSIEVEEFMNLVLFYYSFKILLENNVIDLGSRAVQGKLHGEPEQFDDFINELFIASNYVSNGFKVSMPELLGSESIDIYAEKRGLKIWCECKRLRREAPYMELAMELLQWLHRKRLNLLVDIVFAQTPREKTRLIVKAIRDYIEQGKFKKVHSLDRLTLLSLPAIRDAPLNVRVRLENIEYLVYAGYIEVFEGRLKVKEPKIIIFRNINKLAESIKRIRRRLDEAYKQLKTVKTLSKSERKIIHIDISDIVGAIVIPYLDHRAHKEEALREIENHCKEWLLRHSDIDCIVLTIRRIHLDPFGHPFTLVVEYKTVTPYTPSGWSIMTLIIPVPESFSSEILTNTATVLKEKGLYNIALYYYKKALEINPNLKEAWNNLADLYNRLGMFNEALKCLERALEIDPYYVLALINKGIAIAQLGNRREALNCFDRAISINPKEKKAWYNRAIVLLSLGLHEEALKSLTKALEIDPSYEQAKSLLMMLKTMFRR